MSSQVTGNQPIRLAVVTDELSADVETALELAAELGILAVELRGIGPERFPRVAGYWRQRLPTYLEHFGMSVISMSPGLFKIPLVPAAEREARADAWLEPRDPPTRRKTWNALKRTSRLIAR